ncbi:MAG: esterase [Porticoccaceae bacterium]|nr:esterase [Porticoccaceae bacterium]
MSTFVLCHGGGMGGWIWKFVKPALVAAGHEVYTPTYTGFGEREHLLGPDIDGEVHVLDIVNVLEKEDIRDCILVGHSYSGTVLPGVVAKAGDRVKRVVMLDALIVYSGETIVEAMGLMDKEQAAGILAGVKAGQIPPGSGVHEQQRAMAKDHPMDMSAERQQWLLDNLSDQPLACTVTPVVVGAEQLKGKPVDYVAVTDTIMKPLHARAHELGWTVHELEGDHAFLVGQPEWTADFLLGLA